jgi:hypothetical protein
VWDCYSVCTDSGPISLWASWSMHIEAMNFGGMGHAEDATTLGRMRCASDAIARQIRRRNGLVKPASSECPGSIKGRRQLRGVSIA